MIAHPARLLGVVVSPDRGCSGVNPVALFASGLQLPDGLCLDAEGAVWIGCLFASEFVRVTEGGTITHRVRVPAPYWALAPMLGGADRRTLYMCAADTDPLRAQQHDSHGHLYRVRVRVDVAGASCP